MQIEIFYPTSLTAWRDWLAKNHQVQHAVWLVFSRKDAGNSSITWSEAVDVALCFGCIDSKKFKVDEKKSHQFFSRRKANSTWSKIDKQKVEQLVEAGLMSEAGYKSVETAKQNGSWTMLDQVEELIVTLDLETLLTNKPEAKSFF